MANHLPYLLYLPQCLIDPGSELVEYSLVFPSLLKDLYSVPQELLGVLLLGLDFVHAVLNLLNGH